MQTESKTLAKLNAQRAALREKIVRIDVAIKAIDAAIKAESRKMKEVANRDALAILHKSGVLDDPERLRVLLEKTKGEVAGEMVDAQL